MMAGVVFVVVGYCLPASAGDRAPVSPLERLEMVYKITPYQKSVLLALQHADGIGNENAIVAYLQSVGWVGLDLTLERVEIALEELKNKGLVTDDVTG